MASTVKRKASRKAQSLKSSASRPTVVRKKRSTGQKMASDSLVEMKIKIDKNIWPVERDVLFRPDRLKYVRKLIKPSGCVFCESKKTGVGFESLLLFESKHSMIVLNKFPYNPGHVLVLPKRHCGDLLLLSDTEYADLNHTFRTAFKAVTNAFSPAGINSGLNHGSVAGAGIPEHLHFHIVPRWAGDLNFFPLIADTKALPTDLENSYESLLNELSKPEYSKEQSL